MDLLTGSFLWSKDSVRSSLNTAPLPLKAEIVIVGGGVSGAIIAHSLVESGHEVIVLDKRPAVALGSTLASTAILQYELDVSLTELSDKIGHSAARTVYQESFKSWQKLCLLAETFGAQVDFSRRPSLCLASSVEDAIKLKKEAESLNSESLICSVLSQCEVKSRFSFIAPGALFHQNAAQLNPVKLANQLFDHVQRKGARIFNQVSVSRLRATGVGSVILELNDGRSLTAARVIMACGYEATEFLKPKQGRLVSSYAAATYKCEEKDLWETQAVIWETARPYHYLRVAPGPRIIIGGGDAAFRNPFMRDIILPIKRYLLARKLHSLLHKSRFEFEFAWTGTFGESEDGMPYLGETHSLPGVYFVIGFGGNGITFSMQAASLINKWLANEHDQLMNIFSVDR